MKSILIKTFLIFIFLTQVACNSLSESKRILTNQRVNTTDEFLIEKKEPLAVPPDYKEIPEPGSMTQQKENENLNKILKTSKEKSSSGSASSAEKSILDKIR